MKILRDQGDAAVSAEAEERKYRKALDVSPGDFASRRNLARLLSAQRRWREAVEEWSTLAEQRPEQVEPWLNLGRAHSRLRAFAAAESAYQKALAANPQHAASLRELERTRRAIRNLTEPLPSPAVQHIAIAGVSYCGSTLLSRVLGGLPKVNNVGESHWLTTTKREGRSVAVDFENDDYSKQVQCFSCGESCRVFTKRFRQELSANPTNWYQKIGARLGGRVLVSSDKNYARIVGLDPLLRMDVIVLFKSPAGAWYSNYKKIPARSATMSPVTDVRDYLEIWARSYGKLLEELDPEGDKVYLSFEEFLRDPESHLSRLCDIFGLDHAEGALTSISPEQHCFGGNSRVNVALRGDRPGIDIEAPVKPDLPAAHSKLLAEHDEVNRVYAALRERYQRDFGIPDPAIVDNIESVLSDMSSSQSVLSSKRRMFLNAALDAERSLKIRLRKLKGAKRPSAHRIEFFEGILESIDFAQFRQLHRRYLSRESVKYHVGYVKYLNLDHWFAQKYDLAVRLGLHHCKPIRILDLGTGPGHFPYVCQRLGHSVVGTDVRLPPNRRSNEPHLYDALVSFFGVDRRTHRIEKYQALPDFGGRFDLVTAQLVTFNVSKDGEVWDVPEWQFFLRRLAEHSLTDRGRLFMKMNKTGRNTSQQYVGERIFDYFRSCGADTNEKDSTVLFGDFSRLQ